jgi:tRNA(His) 5'-end guanylyltransferase
MKFDDLDQKMRLFETANDQCALPGIWIIARIDGRSFTRLTKEIHKFEAPYDEQFREHMVATVLHLMNCGFRIPYGYTQSDEISLLFHKEEGLFDRKLRKWVSVLAGEASAAFSIRLGVAAAFDCRLSQLTDETLVRDYFLWRQEDAHRNALNAHCYWTLRSNGSLGQQATERLLRLSVSDKNELLFSHGVNFGKLPNWQKRGIGVVWENYEKPAINPKTGQAVKAIRRRLKAEYELPARADYASFLEQRIQEAKTN